MTTPTKTLPDIIRPYGDTVALPIFQKIFLGGEYSMRGFDLRAVSPRDPVSGVQIGGNKSLLFNAEYTSPSRGLCVCQTKSEPRSCGLSSCLQ